METRLTEEDRRALRLIVKAGEAGRKTHKYFRAKTLLAYDKGLSPSQLVKFLSKGLIRRKPSVREEDAFERNLDRVLQKNAELYQRLAQ